MSRCFTYIHQLDRKVNFLNKFRLEKWETSRYILEENLIFFKRVHYQVKSWEIIIHITYTKLEQMYIT